jgi:hypothetical protein
MDTQPDPLAELRARGADRVDPVRFRYLEALARRAAAHGGDVRQLLERKLAQALSSYVAHCEAAPAPADPAPARLAAQGGPLAALVRQLELQAPAGELRALSLHRHCWTRLRVDRQLSLARAGMPGNAGPLNSQQLVLRALQLMRDISPAYLEGFMSQVETLLWLDRASFGRMTAPPRAARRALKRGPGGAGGAS